MVKLEEVADEDLVQPQEGPIGGEDDWDTDSGTSYSLLSTPHHPHQVTKRT